MSNFLRYFLALLVIVLCTIQLSMAQVTFSRGWGAGKRAALYDCRINAKSLALLVHSLMAEVKHPMVYDHSAAVNYLQPVEH